MPQETKTMNQTKPALSDEQLLKDPASVEIYADQLMDDIFEDVERVIDGGTKLPKDPVEPEFISLKSIKVPQIILPPVVRRDGVGEDGAIDTDVKLRDASAGKDQSFDRILLGTAFASLLVTLSLWVATRGGFSRLFAAAPVAVPADKPLTAKTQADIKFGNYIERSLATIEQDIPQTIPLLPPFPGTPPVENLESIPVPSTVPNSNTSPLGSETNNLIAAINRMADSIQDASDRTARLSNQVMQTLQQQAQQQAQQPQPQAQISTPTPGGQTSGTVSTPATQTAQTQEPAPQPAPQATQQAEAEPQSQPEPQRQPATASVSIPTPATAPAPEPAPEPASEPASAPAPAAEEQPSEAAAATTNPTQGSIHTLVGILELGDRSAALFEVNGVARRVYVGESIAASGWTLVEVVNQEAVIRRNGEVMTIYVGQQF